MIIYIYDICIFSFRSEIWCMWYIFSFRSETTYIWYMILGLDLKLFQDHKSLMHTIKYNLKKNIFGSKNYVVVYGYRFNK